MTTSWCSYSDGGRGQAGSENRDMKNTKFSKERNVVDKEVLSQLKMRLALTTHRYRQTFRQTHRQTHTQAQSKNA